MNTPWQEFQIQQGAKLDDSNQLSFGHDTRTEINSIQTGPVQVTLDHLGVIQVSGEDAQTFLQSQFSNDITLINKTTSQISAYCNPKGRILAQFLVMATNESYLLILPLDIIEKTLQRLRMFVMRSQVVLTDVSNELISFGLIGEQSNSQELDIPIENYQVTESGNTLTVKLPAPISRYLVISPIEQAKTQWESNKHTHTACSHHVWLWLDIQAGIPNIVKDTMEEFVPQMVNLELIEAVNFKKGCYPGQEIVARMHYLGKPKRRMFKLYSHDTNPPAPGTDLYLNGGDGQSAGKIVLAEPSKTDGIDMLAVIRLSHENSDQLRLGSAEGPVIEFTEQPYPLDPD